MSLHPMHPAAWVLDQLHTDGWHISGLVAFTRASTLVKASRSDQDDVVLKAGFGSNHVLSELEPTERPAAYGFYWYAQMTEAERALAREDFRHEAELTAAAGGSDHVVPLLEQGSSERFDWYSMPHCDGGNFRAFMASAKHPGKGLHILADVADGLESLHQRGIVHRDVYQENIVIDQGRGLITDLGAARRLTTPRGPDHRGPEVHWPPEYLTGYHEATPAADVFSLGVLVYRYLCADIPRLGGHTNLTVIPGPLRTLVAGALSDQAAGRPRMDDLRDALRTAANALSSD
jgi:serine/threonine protein kinase